MAQIPRFKKFSREDYQGAPAWFEPLFLTFNEVIGGLTDAISRRLTRDENMLSATREVVFTTKAAMGDTSWPTVKNDLPITPRAVWIGKLEVLRGTDPFTTATSLAWRATDKGDIQVLYIAGLVASTTYKATILYE